MNKITNLVLIISAFSLSANAFACTGSQITGSGSTASCAYQGMSSSSTCNSLYIEPVTPGDYYQCTWTSSKNSAGGYCSMSSSSC